MTALIEKFETYYAVPHRRLVAIVSLMVLAFAVRYAASFVMPLDVMGDAKAYWTMATKLAAGQVMADHMGNYAYYSAGYPILLGLVCKVFGTTTDVVLWVNSLLAVLAVYLIYKLAISLTQSFAVAFLSAVLWAVDLQSIVTANQIAKENLMIPLMVGVVYLASCYKRAEFWKIALSGVLIGVLLVVGPTGVVVAVAWLFAVMARESGWWRRVAVISVMGLVAVIVVTPWLYRNEQVLSRPVLNSNGGFNLYLGNNEAAEPHYVGIEHTRMAEDWPRLRQERGELVAVDHLVTAAKGYIRENPGAAVLMALKRGLAFWEPPSVRQPGISGAELVIRALWLAQYCVLLILSVLCLCWWRQFLQIYGVIAAYVAIHMPFYVMSRYRLPIMIFLCLLASKAIVGWIKRRSAVLETS